MKVLIFGRSGQVGHALLSSVPQGWQAVALSRRECDLADQAAIAARIADAQPDLVINAAAYTAVDQAETEMELSHTINADAPGSMAVAAKRAGSRLVHLSTDFVFDGSTAMPKKPQDAPGPLSAYGRSKLAGEEAVRGHCPDALIVRTAWVYAVHGANFVNRMLGLMNERDTVRVVSDQVGTPTWAPSLAGALWRLIAADAKGIVHYTDAGAASWYDFAVAIAEEAMAVGLLDSTVDVVPISTAEFPALARRPVSSLLDKTDTWALLGGPAPHWRTNLRANLRELKNG